MNRFLLAIFLLVVGVGLGAGGLYVGMNWDRFNPFRDKNLDLTKEFVARLRKACATDSDLKGAFIKSAEITDGKMTLRGIVATKDQIGAVDAKVRSMLAESPELQSQCSSGVSSESLKVAAISDSLPQMQRDFEMTKGVEANVGDNPKKREVMRMTRLDGAKFDSEGVLVFTGVCIRGEKTKDVSRALLRDVLRSQLEAMKLNADEMPEIFVDVRFLANPIGTLQTRLAQDPRGKGIRMLSAHYDGSGRLRLEGLVGKVEDQELINEVTGSILHDMPILAKSVADIASDTPLKADIRAIPLESSAELHKQLIEFAAKTNKPHFRHVKISDVRVVAEMIDKKQVTDDEGNPLYHFHVGGRLLDTGDERKKVESELPAWLAEFLPRMTNADQSPIETKVELLVRDNPVISIQEQLGKRRLDGAVFSDAKYDEKGQLNITGRSHDLGEDAKKVLESALTDSLTDEAPWTIASLKPHESPDGKAIAWSEVVRRCQAKLAQESAGNARLDRLHFAFVDRKLQLVGSGVLLSDSTDAASTEETLRKVVDSVITTRGGIGVSAMDIKAMPNPLSHWQSAVAQRPELDGTVLTGARYDAEGRLQLSGYLGQTEQKAVLSSVLAAQLDKAPALVRIVADPKATQAWSIDALKIHAGSKGDFVWADFVKGCRNEIAGDSLTRRTHLGRLFFRYADDKAKKQLTLQGEAVSLMLPGESVDEKALGAKLTAFGKQILPDLAIASGAVSVQKVEAPIFELQKLALAAGNDGILLKDVFYDADGKLAFDGIRGNVEQAKTVKELIEKYVKERPTLAPHGVASLENLKVVPWQPLMQEIRSTFANASLLYRQTRIDRIDFQFDETKTKAIAHVKGICIYQGKIPAKDDQFPALTELLKKQLHAKGIEGLELSLAGLEQKPNPVASMQQKANETRMDGVDFTNLGFDAKGNCYVKLPLIPKGQEENIRKLLDEFSEKNPHLRTIRQHAP